MNEHGDLELSDYLRHCRRQVRPTNGQYLLFCIVGGMLLWILALSAIFG